MFHMFQSNRIASHTFTDVSPGKYFAKVFNKISSYLICLNGLCDLWHFNDVIILLIFVKILKTKTFFGNCLSNYKYIWQIRFILLSNHILPNSIEYKITIKLVSLKISNAYYVFRTGHIKNKLYLKLKSFRSIRQWPINEFEVLKLIQ